jgi:NADH dehydrogenase FAD-containing subunit
MMSVNGVHRVVIVGGGFAGLRVAKSLRGAAVQVILAAGVRHHYFGRDDWERFAPGLKSVEDATTILRPAG